MTLYRLTFKSVKALLWAAWAVALFLPSAHAAEERLQIVTEEYPPYNMTQNGKLTGLSTEVVQAVLKEVDLLGDIHVLPWARAYDTALNSENVLIYSIVRSPQREQLFKWVGVIAPTRWYLISLADRDIQLKDLDEARRYQIATVNNEAGEQFLIAKGFAVGRNLQSGNKYAFNYEKLKMGRVDLWLCTDLNAYYLVRQAGDDPARMLSRALPLPELDSELGLSMAFGPKTPDALVERFRKGLEAIKKNGVYDGIQKKWL